MTQLPSVQIDLVTEDAAVGVAALIANRNPQPGEVQVPLRGRIAFDHIALIGEHEPGESFVITVDGELAFEEGAFRHGWQGVVAPGSPDDATTRFELTPPIDYLQGSSIEVRVTVLDVVAAVWTFVVFDQAAPLISSAVAVNKDQILVTFTEPVLMENAALPNDALNPANYVIERVSRPAATPTVIDVDRASDSAVLLTTEFELTFGAGYMLVVSDVCDEFDNAILPPLNIAAFAGYQPPFPPGRRFLLHDFVPSVAIAADMSGDLRLFLACLQDSVNLHLHSIDKWSEHLDPDYAPEPFLDAMLADLGNPFEFELDVTDKRKLVKLLVRIYQLKGTAIGIVDVVRFFLGIEVEVEAFNGVGWRLGIDKISSGLTPATPNPAIVGAGTRAIYAFRVVTSEILTPEQRSRCEQIAVYMKGASEHFVGAKDGTPIPPVFRFLKLGVTRLGFTRLAG